MKAYKLIISICLLLLPLSGIAQSAREYYTMAKMAYDDGNIEETLSKLDRCVQSLGGTNARIEGLRAQCYAMQDDYIKAKIAYRNYYNLLPDDQRFGEYYEQMQELGRTINEGLDKAEEKFHDDQKKEKEETKQMVADMVEEQDTKRETKKQELDKTHLEVLYTKAIESRDKELLELVQKEGKEDNKYAKAVANELDKQNNPGKYIVQAVTSRDADEARFLLGKGASANATNSNGESLLHIAAANNDKMMVNVLREAKANADAKNNLAQTPLMVAIKSGASITLMQDLLNMGANSESEDKDRCSVMAYALYYNNVSAVSLLLNHGVSANKNVNIGQRTRSPLYYAVYKQKNREMVAVLLGAGATVNTPGYEEWTPLMAAVFNHDMPMVELLLGNKADPNVKGPHGWTALHFAARENQPDIAKLLLNHGADKSIRDEWNRTAKKVAYENELEAVLKAIRKGR